MSNFIPYVKDVTTFHASRLICIGRNYSEHAIEMGHDPKKEAPFFFFKPCSTLTNGKPIALPRWSQDVHHEIELVVAITHQPKRNNTQSILNSVGAFGLGLDLTARDLQLKAKSQGRPWCQSKSFDCASPISNLVQGSIEAISSFNKLTLRRNDQVVQQGRIDQLIWSVPELLLYLDRIFALQAGDLIFTGTPAGVGPVKGGDTLQGDLEGLDTTLSCKFVDEQLSKSTETVGGK